MKCRYVGGVAGLLGVSFLCQPIEVAQLSPSKASIMV